ncbi:MAG TPA: CAP domain-containing protein, partial [Phycisphaerales bacterium]|nr:CAP domain-containing protein [Phycisphaerales bacterium]
MAHTHDNRANSTCSTSLTGRSQRPISGNALGKASGQSFGLEQLEGRRLLFAWSSDEVYLLELVNRARANPMAEAAYLGVDLTEGLTQGQAARLVPQEPLALNEALTIAARLHSQDMADRGFFDHINPDGMNPTDRATAQGYDYSAGENIAAGYFSMDSVHLAWLQSVEHRLNVLSLYEDFDDSFKYTEFGAGTGIPTIEGDPYGVYQTQMFGYQGAMPDIFVLGVVYTDGDSDDFYTPGEGKSGVEVTVLDAGLNIIGSYTTDAAGNYQISVPNGEYTLVFTELSTGEIKAQQVVVNGRNVKVDAEDAEFALMSDGGGDTGGGDTGGGDTGGGNTGGGDTGGGNTGGGDTGGGNTVGGDTGGGNTGGGDT